MMLIIFICSVVTGLILFSIRARLSKRPFTSNVSMKGKVVIVSGANRGIGLHAALNLARRGARVILACRDEARGAAARDRIVRETHNTLVECRPLDLSSFKFIRTFAANILETEDRLHVLVNNAGVYGYSEPTEDGIVETMQVNYFGHFLLTILLLPLLKKSQPSSIINVSSNLHIFGRFNRATINKKHVPSEMFNIFIDYCNSKFCMILFSVELARRLKGSGVAANAMHPGVISTDLLVQRSNILSRMIFKCWCLLYSRTESEGAQTIEYLAVADECGRVSGKYFVDCESRFFLWTAKNENAGKALWDYSEAMVK